MRIAVLLNCLWIAALSASTTYAQTAPENDTLSIGIVVPFDGPYAILANQILLGAQAAKLQNQYPVNLIMLQEHCSADQDGATAEKIRQKKIKIVIGYLCSESLEGAAPVLARDGIPILSLGSRQQSILEQQTKQNFNIFRLQPDRKQAIDVLVDQLAPSWRTVPFALIEDGTVQGRDFARLTLQALKQRGLEPALTDTYRPSQPAQSALITRLKRAGINHILLGGEGDDAAVIARSAEAANHQLTIAGSETLLRADPLSPLPVGLLMSGIPEADNQPEAKAAVEAINAYARQTGHPEEIQADAYALLAYSALQVASKLNNQSAEDSPDSEQVNQPAPQQSASAFLQKNHFETSGGNVSFTPSGIRKENPYRLMRFNGNAFVPVE